MNKIAVTDANIFIDLFNLDLHAQFFNLPLEIHTTFEVYQELYVAQQEILNFYKSNNKLTIHCLLEIDFQNITETAFPNALSIADKSVLYIANTKNFLLLSSDKLVRTFAKKSSVEYHGILWIFDQLVEQNVLSKSLAIEKLSTLKTRNIIYQNNKQLNKEFEMRLKSWSFQLP